MKENHLQEFHQGVSRLKFESRTESNIVTTADQVRIIFCKHDIIFSHHYYIYAFPLFPIKGQDTFETFLGMREEQILADSSGHIFDPVNGTKFFGDLEAVIPKALWALLAVKEAIRQRCKQLPKVFHLRCDQYELAELQKLPHLVELGRWIDGEEFSGDTDHDFGFWGQTWLQFDGNRWHVEDSTPYLEGNNEGSVEITYEDLLQW